MFALTANKYLAFPKNRLAAAWQSRAVSVQRSCDFLSPFTRLSQRARLHAAGCATQPSWQGRTATHVTLFSRQKKKKKNAAECVLAFLVHPRSHSHHRLQNLELLQHSCCTSASRLIGPRTKPQPGSALLSFSLQKAPVRTFFDLIRTGDDTSVFQGDFKIAFRSQAAWDGKWGRWRARSPPSQLFCSP